jgi:hypothetical protein
MKCEEVQKNIGLCVYDELADDVRCELEQHIGGCATCASEWQRFREFHAALQAFPVQEPSPSLLASSRMRLQESLETTKADGFWHQVSKPAAWFRQVRFAPALASAIFIFMLGFAGGAGTTYKLASRNSFASRNSGTTATASPGEPPAELPVSGIRSIYREPASDQINIKYETVSAHETEGPLNSQRIQQLLLFAARNPYNSGVRMNSVGLLTQAADDTNIRETLMYALRYDAAPRVRLTALRALRPYVKSDVRVRNVMLEALLDDAAPGIRAEALDAVQPVRADSSVRMVLHRLAQKDESKNIRSQARTELALVPRIY